MHAARRQQRIWLALLTPDDMLHACKGMQHRRTTRTLSGDGQRLQAGGGSKRPAGCGRMRARTRELVSKQPQVQRNRLQVTQIIAGGAHGDHQGCGALPERRAVALREARPPQTAPDAPISEPSPLHAPSRNRTAA